MQQYPYESTSDKADLFGHLLHFRDLSQKPQSMDPHDLLNRRQNAAASYQTNYLETVPEQDSVYRQNFVAT